MKWKIEFDKKAKKEFAGLGSLAQKQIDTFLIKLLKSANPRQYGESLKGNLHTFWRYRVGDYRLICTIEDGVFTIFVLKVNHRKEVYKKLS